MDLFLEIIGLDVGLNWRGKDWNTLMILKAVPLFFFFIQQGWMQGSIYIWGASPQTPPKLHQVGLFVVKLYQTASK